MTGIKIPEFNILYTLQILINQGKWRSHERGIKNYSQSKWAVIEILRNHFKGVSYFAAVYLGQTIKLKLLIERIFLVSKRFFGVPSFFNYAIVDGIYNLLYPDKNCPEGKAQ